VTRRVVAPVALVVASALFVVACGGDDGDSVKASDSTTSSSTTSTTAGGNVPDTTPVTIGIICTTAEEAAQAVVAAWGLDDPAEANRCSSAAVVDTLFQTSGTGNTWFFQGCDRTDPGVPVCAFSYEGGAAFFTVEGTEAAGWKTTKLEFLAD
jgi:hypothetical protein